MSFFRGFFKTLSWSYGNIFLAHLECNGFPAGGRVPVRQDCRLPDQLGLRCPSKETEIEGIEFFRKYTVLTWEKRLNRGCVNHLLRPLQPYVPNAAGVRGQSRDRRLDDVTRRTRARGGGCRCRRGSVKGRNVIKINLKVKSIFLLLRYRSRRLGFMR